MRACAPALFAVAVTVSVSPVFAADPVAQAEAALERGQYEKALALARKVSGPRRGEADGVAGEALRRLGRYEEALTLLEAATKRDEKALRARLELGRIYRLRGDKAREKAVWNLFYDDYGDDRIDKKSARQLMYVALAARYLEGWKDANDTFRDAVDADDKGRDGALANLEWAALYLEKYDAGHAEVSLDEAKKVLGKHPELSVLRARVKLEQGYDVAAAEREIAQALALDPRHAGALALRAEILVDNEEYDAALAVCEEIFKTNPHDLRGRTIRATVLLLREDAAGFAAEKKRVLAVNPRASQLLHGVAEFFTKAHRYEEAARLWEEAVKLEPKDWVALAGMGTNYLRLGDDARGLEALRRAWDGDPFNVRTYNQLQLFEEVIAKGYELTAQPNIRLRVAKNERKLLEHYVLPLLERESREMAKRYGLQPPRPLTLELFADPEHYAVRTVGLPGLDALAVTFGRVVTGMSPSLGRFNWGMALWHEMAHVFSIALSRSRVPRWFTEGLAEYETARERPEWTRHTQAELYKGLSEGKLLSVEKLNAGFVRARDVQHMVIAYHQAAETVSFLINRFGFDKAKLALELYAKGKETREVIPAVTGLSIAAFDQAFQKDLGERLAVYAGTFYVRPSDYSDVPALKARLDEKPDDARARGLYALALLNAGAVEEAGKQIAEGEQRKPLPEARRELTLARAHWLHARKEAAGSKAAFEELIASGGDGYDARFGLGRLAAEAKDLAEAEKQLRKAKTLDPHRAEPALLLAKLLLPTREADALVELEEAARLDCMNPKVPLQLLELYAKRSAHEQVVQWAPWALFVTPFDANAHLRYAAALAALGRKKEAQKEAQLGLLCEPEGAVKSALETLAAGTRS
jgi:Flp pilus assembly protein TadD